MEVYFYVYLEWNLKNNFQTQKQKGKKHKAKADKQNYKDSTIIHLQGLTLLAVDKEIRWLHLRITEVFSTFCAPVIVPVSRTP